jgi:hypothetical protein
MIPEKDKKYAIAFHHPHWRECDFVGIATCNGELNGFGDEDNYEQWYGFTNPKDPAKTLWFASQDIVCEVKE